MCYLSKSETGLILEYFVLQNKYLISLDLTTWNHEADVNVEEETQTTRIQLRPKSKKRDIFLEVIFDECEFVLI